jgi:uncharacterized protein HemX
MRALLRNILKEISGVLSISSLLLFCFVLIGVCYATYSGMLSRLVKNGREKDIKATKTKTLTLQEQLKAINNREKLLREKQKNLQQIKKKKQLQLEKQRKIMKNHQSRAIRMEEMAQDLRNIDKLLENTDKKN